MRTTTTSSILQFIQSLDHRITEFIEFESIFKSIKSLDHKNHIIINNLDCWEKC